MPKSWNEVKSSKQSIIDALKTLPLSPDRTTAERKINAAKKWPADAGTMQAIESSYEAACRVPVATAQEIDVVLKRCTRPKFMHNATQAGTLPVWTFEYTNKATRKKDDVNITMTAKMTKDEPTAKRMMAAAALAEVERRYPDDTVRIKNATL